MSDFDSKELDDILSDVRRLLSDDDTGNKAPKAPCAAASNADETRIFTPVQAQARVPAYAEDGNYPWNDPDYIGEYHGGAAATVVKSHSVRVSPSAFDQPLTPPRRAPQEREPQRAEYRAKPTRAERAAGVRVYEEADEDLDEYELPRPKKKHRLRKFILTILILALLGVALMAVLARQPVAAEGTLGARKSGYSTILIAGTDADGTRTDTIMLLSIDSKNKTAGLVSIPRDTLVNGGYRVPKINGCYGWVGGGEDGMEELMTRVSESIGYRPDGYLLVDLDSFVNLVDIMGGVKFDVPVDMYYNDPAQNLYIDLKAGEQKLDGEQSMGLVRFRSGYAAADLQRVNVQREFVSAAAHQWLSPKAVMKIPQLLAWYASNVTTDMSVSNLTWLASKLMVCNTGEMTTDTLPGSATYISGGSYYVLNPYDIAELINRACNPYERDVTVGDLTIRN